MSGKRHSKGSLEGGYRGAQPLTVADDRLSVDKLTMQAREAKAALTTAQRHSEDVSCQLAAVEQHESALAELQKEVETLEVELTAARRSAAASKSHRAAQETQRSELQSLFEASPQASAGHSIGMQELEASARKAASKLDGLEKQLASKEAEAQVCANPNALSVRCQEDCSWSVDFMCQDSDSSVL